MRSFVVPLALLFLAFGVPSNAQKSTVEEVESEVVVAAGAPLRIECRLRVEQALEWSVLRDGEGEGGRGAVASDLRAASEMPAGGQGGAVLAVLAAPRARPAHSGTYRCTRGPAPPHHAVRVTVLPAPHPPGEGSTTASPPSPVNVASTDDKEIVVPFQVGKQNAFQLNCTPTDEAIPGKFTYVWKVNDTEVEAVASLKDRFELLEDGAKFKIKGRAHEDDFGNYTCSIGGPVARAWRVVGMPIAKLPANLNVVEGQKLKITCRVIGKPYPPVEWTYLGADAEGNGTGALAALGERGEVRDSAAGVPGGELVISAAARADAGVYRCTPVGARADDFAETTVRVKGMYDALWPFLGICAEVFLLCAIILVYEKRRTKPELDDSDTDNHDQKKS